MLDLDKAKTDRIAARSAAAGREGRGETQPIRWRGETIAELPPELPLATLAPLQQIDSEIALLLGQVLQVARANGEGVMDAASLLIDLVTGRPELPSLVVKVAREIAAEVLTPDGLDRFLAGAPSGPDAAALVRGSLAWWGISLGESSRSADSVTSGGPISKPTSSAGTGSTPEVSGEPPVPPASSDSDASSS